MPQIASHQFSQSREEKKGISQKRESLLKTIISGMRATDKFIRLRNQDTGIYYLFSLSLATDEVFAHLCAQQYLGDERDSKKRGGKFQSKFLVLLTAPGLMRKDKVSEFKQQTSKLPFATKWKPGEKEKESGVNFTPPKSWREKKSNNTNRRRHPKKRLRSFLFCPGENNASSLKTPCKEMEAY